MNMKPCPVCGIPDVLSRDQVWNPDGTISLPKDKDFKMGFIEVNMFRDIVKRIEAIIGPPIHNMFMEGKRKYARRYIDNLLKGPLGFIVRHTKFGAKKVYEQLIHTATTLGYGNITLEFYDRKQRVGGHVDEAYYAPLLLGDVRGAFESVERLPSKGIWEEESPTRAKISVEKAGEEDKLEKRFIYEDTIRLPGEIKYERCEKCGLPVELQRFKWITEKGFIMDEKSQQRFFCMGLNDINAVLVELEEAIGDVIPGSIFEANKDEGLAQVKAGVIKDLDGLSRDMALKGMGNLTVSREGDLFKVTIKNLFNKNFMMGRVIGTIEGLEGPMDEPKVVKEEPGLLEFTIKKK
jgi:hypothetical protein